MDSDFPDPLSNPTATSRAEAAGLLSNLWNLALSTPPAVLVSIGLAPIMLVCCTRLLSGHPSRKITKDLRSVWLLPYWIPILGHGFQFLSNPIKLMSEARDRSAHGIFSLNLGATIHNISKCPVHAPKQLEWFHAGDLVQSLTGEKVSDPGLVRGVMQQKESAVQFWPIAWNVCEKFFGFPRSVKGKYEKHLDKLNSYSSYLMREPYLSNVLSGTICGLQENIPQMISFAQGEIDLQPWERWAEAAYISDSETEVNLMSLMRDMLGHASVPGVFGRGLMDKYPDILHDIYDMDAGFVYFLIGLPQWTPWPSVNRAHRARQRIWRALDEQQRALDSMVEGQPFDSTWGDLDDVSELILQRHALFKAEGFEIKERGDLSMLWALVVNANILVYWQLLHILATPGLVARIRSEITPYAIVSKPVSIGNFSATPVLTLLHDGLAKSCPLFRSTYLEALRISDQPWSVRQVAADVVISGDKQATDPVAFALHKGDYITIPHDLHMKDPKYFKEPERFDPERFLIHNEDGSLYTDMGTIRPYGGGPSMCKGRVFAERECLALVAGVLMYWDIKPADEMGGWIIPKQKKASAISLPVHDTKVRIKRRKFDWDG